MFPAEPKGVIRQPDCRAPDEIFDFMMTIPVFDQNFIFRFTKSKFAIFI